MPKMIRWAFPLILIGLALGTFGFAPVVGPSHPAPALTNSNLSQVELGRQLFIAKGCTTCHARTGITRSENTIYVDTGPSLTTLANPAPEYLKAWLKKPTSIKSNPDAQIEIERNRDQCSYRLPDLKTINIMHHCVRQNSLKETDHTNNYAPPKKTGA